MDDLTNETTFEEMLQQAIEESEVFGEDPPAVNTFEERGILTLNKGLVVTLPTGEEFQITIVKSN